MAQGWSLVSQGTVDHFHQCHTGTLPTGQSMPPSTWVGYEDTLYGSAYAGLIVYENSGGGVVDYREYMQIQLSSPLVAGQTYTIGFRYALAEESQYASDGLGMLLSNGALNYPGTQTVIPGSPQLEASTVLTDTNWTLMSGTFVATGGEDHLVIGCWMNDGAMTTVPTGFGTWQYAYYFVDNVFVTSNPCDATISTQQTDYCANATAFNLQAMPGGIWSGTGITDTLTGLFDPGVAGPGVHEIIYAIGGSCNTMDTVYLTVHANDSAGLNYPNPTYCINDPDPSPIQTGTPGGNYTISAGGSINSTTGVVDLSASGAGTYTVTYSTQGFCPASATATVTVTGVPSPSILQVGPFCVSAPAITLNAASPGGTWSGNGITDGIAGTFDPGVASIGNHTITYTVGVGNCQASDSIVIVINAEDTANFFYSTSGYCVLDANPSPTIVSTPGGSFTIDNGGSIDPSTGSIDLAGSGAGNFVVTYTTSGPCPDTDTAHITIAPASDASILSSGPFCVSEPIVVLTATTQGGSWSGPGIIDNLTGEFDPGAAGTGNHIITYTISGLCSDSDTITITVTPSDVASFAYSSNVFGLTSPDPTPTVTGSTGGTFSIDNGGLIDPNTGEIDIAGSGLGTFLVTYTTNGPCPVSVTIEIQIMEHLDPEITVPNVFTPNNDGMNDHFVVPTQNVSEIHVSIFNRWGTLIFEWDGVDGYWDGTNSTREVPEGTYFYVINAVDLFDETHSRKGHFTLIR